MRVEIYPSFATEDEINALNKWTELGVKHKWLDTGVSNGVPCTNRVTSRFYGDRFQYPLEAYTLQVKINDALGLGDFSPILGHGKDGIVVSYTMEGGDVYKHKDPRSNKGIATLRCNILTQKPEAGCQLYVEGQPISFNVGDLHCYLVSEHEHWATPVQGSTPRIMWMFGAHVPAEDWNNNKIRMKNVS